MMLLLVVLMLQGILQSSAQSSPIIWDNGDLLGIGDQCYCKCSCPSPTPSRSQSISASQSALPSPSSSTPPSTSPSAVPSDSKSPAATISPAASNSQSLSLSPSPAPTASDSSSPLSSRSPSTTISPAASNSQSLSLSPSPAPTASDSSSPLSSRSPSTTSSPAASDSQNPSISPSPAPTASDSNSPSSSGSPATSSSPGPSRSAEPSVSNSPQSSSPSPPASPLGSPSQSGSTSISAFPSRSPSGSPPTTASPPSSPSPSPSPKPTPKPSPSVSPCGGGPAPSPCVCPTSSYRMEGSMFANDPVRTAQYGNQPLGTLDQITGLSDADRKALAQRITTYDRFYYQDGFVAYVATASLTRPFDMTFGTAAVHPLVTNWGAGATKAVVACYRPSATSAATLGFGTDPSNIQLLCQVDRMQDDGTLANSQPLTLTITADAGLDLTGLEIALVSKLGTVEKVSIQKAADGSYSATLPHTSAISFQAIADGASSGSNKALFGLLALLIIPIVVIPVVVIICWKKHKVSPSQHKNQRSAPV